MTELEEVAEGARDAVLEEVEHPVKKQPGWVAWLAISTMVMALFCAVGALMAGITANEAVMERTHEIMEVVNRDRDQIEIEILRSKHDVLKALGVAADENERKIVEKSRDVGKLTERDQGRGGDRRPHPARARNVRHRCHAALDCHRAEWHGGRLTASAHLAHRAGSGNGRGNRRNLRGDPNGTVKLASSGRGAPPAEAVIEPD